MRPAPIMRTCNKGCSAPFTRGIVRLSVSFGGKRAVHALEKAVQALTGWHNDPLLRPSQVYPTFRDDLKRNMKKVKWYFYVMVLLQLLLLLYVVYM